MGEFVTSNGKLVNVHEAGTCANEHCVIHNPSDHHMREWPLIWRGDGLFDVWRGFERICAHGVGHPDPDDLAFRLRRDETAGIHGCDGCCGPA